MQSSTPAFYNENDPKAAAWLRELIAAGLIAPGVVDERSIVDLTGDDLAGFTQVHLFGGVGGWSYALRLAGVPDDRPVWTGSCPCQPWSNGNVWQGGGKGRDDKRHLWPEMFRLIKVGKPAILVGEQVGGAIAKGWLDGVFIDLESAGYACGASVLPAYAVEAEHQRNRLFWVAYSGSSRWARHQPVKRLPISASPSLSFDGDTLVRARRALAGDYSGLLPCDGLSVQLERDALKGFGNAIVPPLAAEFILSALETEAPHAK